MKIDKPKTHVLISFTGVHYFINADQEKQLSKVGDKDRINIDGSVVVGKNISDVLTIEKYYQTFPNKRPSYNRQDFTGLSDIIRNFSEERKQKAMQSIITGFKKHFQGRVMPLKSQKMLDGFLLRVNIKWQD